MSPPACSRVQAELDAAPPGASVSEGAGRHLVRCATCREYAAMVGRARWVAQGTIDRTPGPSRVRDRERIIQRALLVPEPAPTPPRRQWWPVVGALALGAAAAALVPRFLQEPPATNQLAMQAEPPLPDDGAIDALPGRELRFDHARVAVTTQACLRWRRSDAAIELTSGAIDVQVDANAALRVVTDRFSVDVLGTRFRVDATSVHVIEGTARVLAPDGAVLADRLSAGVTWMLPAEVPPALTRRVRPSRPPTVAATIDASAALARVRSLLSEGHAREAQTQIDELLARPIDRAARAEAETLSADGALVAGDHARAAALYRRVVDHYKDLAAAEVALFAAARLEQQRGDVDGARRLLDRYLERHPRGLFAPEARKRLAGLAAAH